MAAEALAKLGDSSATCTKRWFDPDAADGLGEPCGEIIPLHGYHWVAEVCPKCLKCYRYGSGSDNGLYPDHGFFPPDQQTKIRANIASNGGKYVPTF